MTELTSRPWPSFAAPSPKVSPDEDYGRRVSAWNDMHHRTRADAIRLYDVTIARVAAAA